MTNVSRNSYSIREVREGSKWMKQTEVYQKYLETAISLADAKLQKDSDWLKWQLATKD